MSPATLVVLAALWFSSVEADINVTEYIFWRKSDIETWHAFFPTRALEEERLTLKSAEDAVVSLGLGLNASLNKIVAFQQQELETAQLLMADTDAEGCVNGISDYMSKAIQDEIVNYEDCSADALSKLARLNNSWLQVKARYWAAYNRALKGIDICAKTYPNKDSIDRLKSCVDSMNTNYFNADQIARNSVFPSPSMAYFQETVVGCASEAATNVAVKGAQFLKMLVECAVLSHTVDPSSYGDELDKWPGYNDTLASQITYAQHENYNQVLQVETEMENYYHLQKQALDQYVLESRGYSTYLNKIYLYLSDYYNTVTQTTLDNPGDSMCTAIAKQSLDAIAYRGATDALVCDNSIVSTTTHLITQVYGKFFDLNTEMPTIGNVAILTCFSQGYIFAPNTIADCFQLTYTGFDLDHDNSSDVISKDVETISNYLINFNNESTLPCGNLLIQRVFLKAATVLYNLQRCLYVSTGTTYSVTIPQPVTTTTSPAITTYSTAASYTTTTTTAVPTTTVTRESTTNTTAVPTTTVTRESTTAAPNSTVTTHSPPSTHPSPYTSSRNSTNAPTAKTTSV